MTEEYIDYIEDIVEASKKIKGFTSGMTYEDLLRTRKLSMPSYETLRL